MFTRRAALIGAVFVAAPAYVINTTGAQQVASNGGAKPADFSALTRRKLKLAAPPFVHAHQQVATTGPEIIEFEMKIVENEIQFDEEVWLQAFTFNGSTPGPMMVVHHGDYVELTLFNPPLDHAAAHHRLSRRHGRAGWGAMTLVNLGEKTVLRFKATTPAVSSITVRRVAR
jgi:nitrite reductase (NO-forming)